MKELFSSNPPNINPIERKVTLQPRPYKSFPRFNLSIGKY